MFAFKKNGHEKKNWTIQAAAQKDVVSLTDVVKTFETPAGIFTALKGVSFQVLAGEFVSVVGKSGSGKSTLINMITGIDRPSKGELYVCGAAVHTLNEEQIALWRGEALGIVFQFFQLLPTLTAVENVMLPMDLSQKFPIAERPERAIHLLEEMGMADQAHTLPPALSGGQQQRVAIARALANDPALLVADEPTGNLDSHTADTVFQYFGKLAAAGKTVLMVTHDDELAERTSRTILIADGLIQDDIRRNGVSRSDLHWMPHMRGNIVKYAGGITNILPLGRVRV